MRTNLRIPIKRRDWLPFSKPGETLDLVRKGQAPKAIEGWMLVVSLKHPLRAVYGSDLKAAWALLWWAIENKITGWIDDVRYRFWPPKDEDFE